MVDLYKVQLFDIIYYKGFANDLFCGNVLHICPKTEAPSTLFEVKLPPTTSSTPKTQRNPTGKGTFNMLHLSDLHYDPNYREGKSNDCGEPLCCQADQKDGDPAKGTAAQKFGDYKCDVPEITLDSMLQDTLQHKPDHILFTGDIVAHNIWQQTVASNENVIKNSAAKISETFKNAKFHPAIGNHEPAPLNLMAPDYVNVSDGQHIKNLFKYLWGLWGEQYKWIDPSQKESFLKGGYYMSTLDEKAKIRLLTINSNLNYKDNWWLMVDNGDIDGQLAWIVSQLEDAEANGYGVYISGHVPPGDVDMNAGWSSGFAKVVNRFANTIVGQFYGHTHTDSFYVQPSESDTEIAAGAAFVVGSVTTYEDLNPGYRIFSIDSVNGALVDHQTHIADLEAANKNGSLKWFKEYSAVETYGVKDCTPQSILNFVKEIFDKDDNIVDLYTKYYQKSYPVNVNADTRKAARCAVRKYVNGDDTLCDDSSVSDMSLYKTSMFTKRSCSN